MSRSSGKQTSTNPSATWLASTAYVVGQLALYGGVLYSCSTSHTSTSSFDATKFTAVTSSSSTTLTPTTVATMGASQAISLAGMTSSVWDGTLSAASCALSFTNFPASAYGEVLVRVHQDGTTSGRAITFSDTIIWAGGYAPIMPKATSSTLEFTVYSVDGGITKLGVHGQPIRTHTFRIAGAISVNTGKDREYFKSDSRIVAVRMTCGDAPVTTSAVCDVKKGGTTIYSTTANRPAVAAASNTGVAALPDTLNVDATEYLTVDVVTPSTAGYLALAVTAVEAA